MIRNRSSWRCTICSVRFPKTAIIGKIQEKIAREDCKRRFTWARCNCKDKCWQTRHKGTIRKGKFHVFFSFTPASRALNWRMRVAKTARPRSSEFCELLLVFLCSQVAWFGKDETCVDLFLKFSFIIRYGIGCEDKVNLQPAVHCKVSGEKDLAQEGTNWNSANNRRRCFLKKEIMGVF